MQQENNHIALVVLSSVIMLSTLMLMIVDIFIRYRKRKIQHENEILKLNEEKETLVTDARNNILHSVFTSIYSEIHNKHQHTLLEAVQYLDAGNSNQLITENLKVKLRNKITEAIHETRTLSSSVYMDYRRHFELDAFLERTSMVMNDTGNCKFIYEYDLMNEIQPESNAILIINVLQELLNNSIKHSEAQEVKIMVKSNQQNQIEILYCDNGVGFDLSNTANGTGLKSIKRSLGQVGANWNIESNQQMGFRMNIQLYSE